MEQIEEIVTLPLQFVVLHVADKFKMANIDVTGDYYDKVKLMVNAQKKNGERFVNMCNSQAEPYDEIKQLVQGKYEVFTEMTNRAGNLTDEKLIHNEIKHGKLACGNQGKELNSNVLLPDGTVVLCCMDYGLKHILGNIYNDSFYEIMNGKTKCCILEGMQGDESIDILCRNCSYARQI